MTVEPIEPVLQDISPTARPLDISNWYLTPTASGVTEESLPWLLAQGYEITGTDTNLTTGIVTYNLRRVTLQSYQVLETLLREFLFNFDEGREHNQTRYEDIITGLSDMLDKQQAEVKEFQEDKAQNVAGYITLMITNISSLETDYNSMASDFNGYDTGDRETALALLKTQWESAANSAQTEYATTTAGLDLPTIIAATNTAMSTYANSVSSFYTSFNGLNALLLGDFSVHEATTRALLVDLGTSELVRINEQFDSTLSAQTQQLVDRGLYSSALTTDVTARNTRDRDDAIAALNDKLNREKLTNEHTLYDQKFRMRLAGLEAKLKLVEAQGRLVSMRLQEGQWEAEIRHKIASISTAARLDVLGIREKYYKTLLDSIDWESDRRLTLHKLLTETRLRQHELRTRTLDKDFELLRYQLDERNNLAAALFAFVERRTDAYPDMGQMAQLTASLGETGAATWQST